MRGIKFSKPIKIKKSVEVRYRRELLRLVRAMYKGLSEEALKLFETKDLNYIQRALKLIEEQYSNIVSRESNAIINQFVDSSKTSIKKELGIGWAFEYEERLKADIINNVALIRNIPEKAIFEISQDVYNSIANDENTEALEFKLRTRKGITERRADTIARDQTAKFYATMNEISQTSNGFEYYMWVTANDERVSTGNGGHKQLNGKIYKWEEKIEDRKAVIDSYGNTGNPSQRVNCRCFAKAVIVEDGFKMVWNSEKKSYEPIKI